MAEYEIGDEVEGVGMTGGTVRGSYAGPSETEPGAFLVDTEEASGWIVSSLRLIRKRGESEGPKEADRLFDTGCCFCGGEVDTFMRAETSDGERGYCSKHKGEPWFGYAGPEYDRRKSLRSQPAPTSDGPKVGETWVCGDGAGNESTICVTSVDDVGFVHFADGGAYPVGANVARGFRRLLRRSPAPPPTPPVEKVAACPHRNVNLYTMRCDDCGMTNERAMVARTTDPYRAPVPNPNSYALWSAEQERRHAARIEAHKRDLDRATAERERNTRHWPEAWSTAGDES